MNAELVCNLWAVYDAGTGFIYCLMGKAYQLEGSDEEKLAVLRSLSRTDFVTCKRYSLPERFRVSYPDGSVRAGVTMLDAVDNPNSGLFESMFLDIEKELPPILDMSEEREIQQKLSNSPLCIKTVLYEDELGNITPVITDKDREYIAQHQQILQGV